MNIQSETKFKAQKSYTAQKRSENSKNKRVCLQASFNWKGLGTSQKLSQEVKLTSKESRRAWRSRRSWRTKKLTQRFWGDSSSYK